MPAIGVSTAVAPPTRVSKQIDVYARLSAHPALDRPLAAARIALSRHRPRLQCPLYLATLERALWEEYPPFVTELYATLQQTAASSGQWLATWLMTSAEQKGERARKLWSLASIAGRADERQFLKRHACAQSGHVPAYLKLLDLVFPGALDPEFRSELEQFSPGFSTNQKLPRCSERHNTSVHQFLQLNFASIRAAIHNVNLRPCLLGYSPGENKRRVNKVMDALLKDELAQIAGTTAFIERTARSTEVKLLEALFNKNLNDFNRAISEEPIEYSYGHRFGSYP